MSEATTENAVEMKDDYTLTRDDAAALEGMLTRLAEKEVVISLSVLRKGGKLAHITAGGYTVAHRDDVLMLAITCALEEMHDLLYPEEKGKTDGL